ncbi:MAG: tyrosine-type recombinase/integrase [Clostridiales Family XIII bacterium]|jgi:integrase|nr:tyrosine-type recombinase/integrase [Clostridiales Family XIII bacterium]
MAATEPIRDRRQLRRLADYFLEKGQVRNHVLVVLAVHTALRVGDLLSLTWDDMYDFRKNRVHKSIRVTEKKTGKAKSVALHRDAVRALELFAGSARQGRSLFENPRTGKAISRVQAYRVVRAAAEELGMGRVSCHSLRKTFGYFAWKGGRPLAVIMEIYNHSSLAVTRRYLGVAQDDKDKVYLGLRLLA